MAKRNQDAQWIAASRTIRTLAKLSGWKVTYYGGGGTRQRDWIMLVPPPATIHRNAQSATVAYRRGDDFMRRGPYYSLLARYDQQERVPLS